MRFPTPPLRTTAAAALAALALTGCSAITQFNAYPGGRQDRDDLNGTWQNGAGQTIEFTGDSDLTITGDAFGPGEGLTVPGGEADGEWELCFDLAELEEKTADDPADTGECTINSTGNWLIVDIPEVWQGYLVVVLDDEVRLHFHTPGEGRDDDYFTKR
ncbi:hypothetical protein GCM10009830_16940 [Glycomyces endophyticus]|uniref:Lipocalin-like domain-containing protein n=1 Tax=Glycomyces endophyticus TaxID=480996 RepID=A0ABN2GI12_9ACTN